jgi:hypothetical protein
MREISPVNPLKRMTVRALRRPAFSHLMSEVKCRHSMTAYQANCLSEGRPESIDISEERYEDNGGVGSGALKRTVICFVLSGSSHQRHQ